MPTRISSAKPVKDGPPWLLPARPRSGFAAVGGGVSPRLGPAFNGPRPGSPHYDCPAQGPADFHLLRPASAKGAQYDPQTLLPDGKTKCPKGLKLQQKKTLSPPVSLSDVRNAFFFFSCALPRACSPANAATVRLSCLAVGSAVAPPGAPAVVSSVRISSAGLKAGDKSRRWPRSCRLGYQRAFICPTESIPVPGVNTGIAGTCEGWWRDPPGWLECCGA